MHNINRRRTPTQAYRNNMFLDFVPDDKCISQTT